MTQSISLNEIYNEGCYELVEDNSYTININKLLNKEQLRNLEIEKYPLTKIDLEKDFFKDKDLEISERYIGPAIARSGELSECYFGKIKGTDIYFYIMEETDDYDGFEFESKVRLYYSDSLEIAEENMEYIQERKAWMLRNYGTCD